MHPDSDFYSARSRDPCTCNAREKGRRRGAPLARSMYRRASRPPVRLAAAASVVDGDTRRNAIIYVISTSVTLGGQGVLSKNYEKPLKRCIDKRRNGERQYNYVVYILMCSCVCAQAPRIVCVPVCRTELTHRGPRIAVRMRALVKKRTITL